MRNLGWALAALAALPASAAMAQSAAGEPPLTVVGVFVDAIWYIKAVMVVLVLGAVSSLGIWARGLGKLRSGDARGLAAAIGGLKMVRSAALPLGLLTATYILMYGFIGMANMTPTPPVSRLAQGWAEAGLAMTLAALATTVAVICERHLETRLRQAAV